LYSFILERGAESVEVKALPQTTQKRQLSLKWVELSNGDVRAADRGSDADRYGCTVAVAGSESYIESIRSFLVASMRADELISMTNVKSKALGVDVDYTQPVQLYCVSVGIPMQTSLNMYRLDFELRSGVVSFISGLNELPSLNKLKAGRVNGRRLVNEYRQTIYNDNAGGFSVAGVTDNGQRVFEGVFWFYPAEMRQVLTFQRLTRSNHFDMPAIAGVDFPFGQESGSTGLKARLREVSGVQGDSVIYQAKLVFVEAVNVN
jgi:hypothetical protein